jgi:hypothetical protein
MRLLEVLTNGGFCLTRKFLDTGPDSKRELIVSGLGDATHFFLELYDELDFDIMEN